jgi:hypothetical protein
VSGRDLRVRVVRIGADFVEAEPERPDATAAVGSAVLVPFGAVRAVRGDAR